MEGRKPEYWEKTPDEFQKANPFEVGVYLDTAYLPAHCVNCRLFGCLCVFNLIVLDVSVSDPRYHIPSDVP